MVVLDCPHRNKKMKPANLYATIEVNREGKELKWNLCHDCFKFVNEKVPELGW